LLGVQFLTPFLCIFLPVAICTVFIIQVSVPSQILVEIGLLCTIIYGASNSLLTIGFIAPYRTHCLNSIVFPLLRFVGFKISYMQNNVRVVPTTNIIQTISR
jgi:hypothetical protein